MIIMVKEAMWNGCQSKRDHVVVIGKGTTLDGYHGKINHVEWLSE